MTAERKTKRRGTLRMAAAGITLTTGLSLALPGAVLPDGILSDVLPGAATSGGMAAVSAAESGEKVTLRIANWEEYIDEGDWTRKKRSILTTVKARLSSVRTPW